MPDWIVVGAQPVPLLAAFQNTALTTRIHAFIMSLIDGDRSLKDMARILVEQRLMAPRTPSPRIRGFLIKMYEEARQRRRSDRLCNLSPRPIWARAPQLGYTHLGDKQQ